MTLTHNTSQFELSIPLDYIESTIPAGMTIAEYRASRPQRSHRFSPLRSLLSQPPTESR